jgi:hypothetical protein
MIFLNARVPRCNLDVDGVSWEELVSLRRRPVSMERDAVLVTRATEVGFFLLSGQQGKR